MLVPVKSFQLVLFAGQALRLVSKCYFDNSWFPTSHLLPTSLTPRSLLPPFSVSPSARWGGSLGFYFGLGWLSLPCLCNHQPVS